MNGIQWKYMVDALERRLVAIPGELAGYLVLGVVDALGDKIGFIEPGDVELCSDGRVNVRRIHSCDRERGELQLRRMLCELLHLAASPTPGLLRAADLAANRDGRSFLLDLQAALIPVNRSAARRALARFHREVARVGRTDADATSHADGISERSNFEPVVSCAAAVRESAARSHTVNSAAVPNAGVVEREAQPNRSVRIDQVAAPPPVVCLPAVFATQGNGIGRSTIADNEFDAGNRLVEIPDLELGAPSTKANSANTVGSSSNNEHSVDPGASSEPAEPVASAIESVPCVVGEDSSMHEWTMPLPLAAPRADINVEPSDLMARADLQAMDGGLDAIVCTRAINVAEAAAVREPTLVIAPVTSASALERTLPIALKDGPVSAVAACEPSVELPLVRRRSPFRSTDPSAEPSCWEVTSLDSVIEVSDDEIVYDDFVAKSASIVPEIGALQVALKTVLPAPSGNCQIRQDDAVGWEESPTQGAMRVPPTSSFGRMASQPQVGLSDIEGCAGWLDRLESVHVEVSDCGPAEPCLTLAAFFADDGPMGQTTDAADGILGSEIVLESREPLEPLAPQQTVYREPEVVALGPRSTVEALSEQFFPMPLWTDVELCRGLRHMAGVDLTPIPSAALTHTPPPTVETIATRYGAESNEPTRRLRRCAATLAVVGVVGLTAMVSMRPMASPVAAASQHPTDALTQICRATVTVSKIVSGQDLRIRQLGDPEFRRPTHIVDANAHFGGLRCGEDVELLVNDSSRVGLRRIPISGAKLTPMGSELWAHVDLELDGPS